MKAVDEIANVRTVAWRSEAGIPVRSLWMLLVYASGLARFMDRVEGAADDAAELPEVLARLLTFVVERRLRRNLSRAYQRRDALLTRVRGRIDWLRTESGAHLQRGEVACSFEELTNDTPRNRLVRAALEAMSMRVADAPLEHDCRTLARDLARLGVGAGRPSRTEMAREQIGRHEADDRLMVTVATLALDLVLPGEAPGAALATGLARDEALLRRIFEQAITGFYRHELSPQDGWRVRPQHALSWSMEEPTDRLSPLMPGMFADIVLEQGARRLVIDTKFANIVTARQYGGEAFKSANIYQLYAYLRSQAGIGDPVADRAEGMLLYPTVDVHIDEAVTIQGHRIRFATVDLASPPDVIRRRLLDLAMCSR